MELIRKPTPSVLDLYSQHHILDGRGWPLTPAEAETQSSSQNPKKT